MSRLRPGRPAGQIRGANYLTSKQTSDGWTPDGYTGTKSPFGTTTVHSHDNAHTRTPASPPSPGPIRSPARGGYARSARVGHRGLPGRSDSGNDRALV